MKRSTCHPIFTASLLLLYLAYTHAGLLPYGPGPGDYEVTGLREDEYNIVFLDRSFKFHGEWYRNLSLTWAGNINLDFGYDDTNGFPTTNDNSLNNLIAVLWTHLVPGTLFYREELDPEAERVKMAGRFVRETLGLVDFVPHWAFIATWVHMHDGQYVDPPNEDITFQIALVANATHSYALMLYDNIHIRNNIMDGTIGVHAMTNGVKYYRELCEGALGDIMAGRKQSQCQSMTGMRAFRIDEITNGPCIRALDATKGCNSGKGCTDSLCPLCNTDTGNCVACIECNDDADCTTPGRPHCNEETGCCEHCPMGMKEKTIQGCATPGSIGGPCNEGKCRGKYVRCNLLTNKCMCHKKYNPTIWYQYRRGFP